MENNQLNPLRALTHLDGRNAKKVAPFRKYFSELAWMEARLKIMVKYLFFLTSNVPEASEAVKGIKITTADETDVAKLETKDGERVREIEKETNHDLRALEVFLKERFKKTGWGRLSPFINLGIGSEDINNVALRLAVKDAWFDVMLPQILSLKKIITGLCEQTKSMPMLARTHGQPASVTTLGKELSVFLFRLVESLEHMKKPVFKPKFSGETGNLNALKFVIPTGKWWDPENELLKSLGFAKKSVATQIAPYEDLLEFFDNWKRLNRVLLSLCKDVWLYAGYGYFKLANVKGEAGSSGMPHKINPQYFEGAEGGLEMADSLLEFFSRKLSYNRMQRDFSDSTVRRNFCLPFAYSFLSYQNLITGFGRLAVNEEKIKAELNEHWEVLSETLHTALKLSGRDDAYILVRDNFRGRPVDRKKWQKIIEEMPLNLKLKERLKCLKPEELTGEAEEIVNDLVKHDKNIP